MLRRVLSAVSHLRDGHGVAHAAHHALLGPDLRVQRRGRAWSFLRVYGIKLGKVFVGVKKEPSFPCERICTWTWERRSDLTPRPPPLSAVVVMLPSSPSISFST